MVVLLGLNHKLELSLRGAQRRSNLALQRWIRERDRHAAKFIPKRSMELAMTCRNTASQEVHSALLVARHALKPSIHEGFGDAYENPLNYSREGVFHFRSNKSTWFSAFAEMTDKTLGRVGASFVPTLRVVTRPIGGQTINPFAHPTRASTLNSRHNGFEISEGVACPRK